MGKRKDLIYKLLLGWLSNFTFQYSSAFELLYEPEIHAWSRMMWLPVPFRILMYTSFVSLTWKAIPDKAYPQSFTLCCLAYMTLLELLVSQMKSFTLFCSLLGQY